MQGRRTWVEQIMGMPISVLVRGSDPDRAEGAVARVFAELRRVDGSFSTYQADSEISRLATGLLTLAECSDDVRDVAHRCSLATRSTGGLFDATTPAGTWDPSGLVKGWAAERASRFLAAVDEVDWCLNAGGDVVVDAPSGEPFTVGLQDPRDPQRVTTTVQLVRGAVATSGTAARGQHLYDPRTAGPTDGPWLSVSVTGPSLETADVLATAAFIAGAQWRDLLPPDYGGLAIDGNGELHRSPTWP